ncbi:response regulator [Microbacterium saperdae]|uniref:LuxR family two component transcriptional regulator n=1 Tax=Microbacterium saperdae TaxID=69368 RepID=A0A543BAD9_9MICO|nr:response regulator transcription factor [Microbacterium saperdae]TQL81703.1 LuxR family two component transcriptional regulator [Microbacterium saperdae]GGM34158.1 DNA-binding response regulator [Microbacterium saperdae]
MTALTVLLVDDHPIVRAGVRSLFDRRDDIAVVGEASSGEEAVALTRHLHPDVVLCDLRLGEGMDGVQTTAALRALDHAPAVIILTTFDRDAEILGAIEAGAAGYLRKDIAPDDIVRAIRQAASGALVLTAELTERVERVRRAPRVRLTERELDVLRLLDTGSSNREIAKTLFVTEATVKTHLVHVFEKLGADSRARALAIARESGLI